METGFDTFDRTVHESHAWLKEIMLELGTDDRHQAWAALKAVMCTLRDRLPLAEAADLSAQLPMLIRGAFFEGWTPERTPAVRTRKDFIEAVGDRLEEHGNVDAEEACSAVMHVLVHKVSPGEIAHVKQVLPSELKPMLEIPEA